MLGWKYHIYMDFVLSQLISSLPSFNRLLILPCTTRSIDRSRINNDQRLILGNHLTKHDHLNHIVHKRVRVGFDIKKLYFKIFFNIFIQHFLSKYFITIHIYSEIISLSKRVITIWSKSSYNLGCHSKMGDLEINIEIERYNTY